MNFCVTSASYKSARKTTTVECERGRTREKFLSPRWMKKERIPRTTCRTGRKSQGDRLKKFSSKTRWKIAGRHWEMADKLTSSRFSAVKSLNNCAIYRAYNISAQAPRKLELVRLLGNKPVDRLGVAMTRLFNAIFRLPIVHYRRFEGASTRLKRRFLTLTAPVSLSTLIDPFGRQWIGKGSLVFIDRSGYFSPKKK